jgi:hypothetical protein
MVTLTTSMTLSDLDNLEEVFATLTAEGWRIPNWLKSMRKFYLDNVSSLRV